MDITTREAITFCNEQVRVMADAETTAYFSAKAIVADWFARDLSTLIPNDASPIKDAANPVTGIADGRPQITGAKVTNIITRAMELIADLEADNCAKLNTLLAVRVNGGAKF